jgi:hypothetical protein
MTKVCRDCQRELPLTAEHFYTKGNGKWDTYCRPCRRARTKRAHDARMKTPEGLAEVRAYQRRKQATYRERHPERERKARQRRWSRIKADAPRHDQLNVNRRIDARLMGITAEGQRTRVATDAYRPPYSTEELVDAEPLIRFLRDAFPGADHIALAEVLDANTTMMMRLVSGRQPQVALHVVDRMLTVGLRRPDLVAALYPLEAA